MRIQVSRLALPRAAFVWVPGQSVLAGFDPLVAGFGTGGGSDLRSRWYLKAMDRNATVLERAFQLARSGRCSSIATGERHVPFVLGSASV
jgi:hypothetical protein